MTEYSKNKTKQNRQTNKQKKPTLQAKLQLLLLTA